MEHRPLVCVPSGTKKNVNRLPSHIEGGEDNAREHQVMWQGRDGPMRRAVQDFFLRPAARKEEGNAAQIHHADGVSEERHRHDPAQAAHFADVLFMIKSVNDGASTEKEQRFEKAMRSEEHTSELQSRRDLVCRLLLEQKNQLYEFFPSFGQIYPFASFIPYDFTALQLLEADLRDYCLRHYVNLY